MVITVEPPHCPLKGLPLADVDCMVLTNVPSLRVLPPGVRGKVVRQRCNSAPIRMARFPSCSRCSTSKVVRPARIARLFSLNVDA